MAFFTGIGEQLAELRALLGCDPEPGDVPATLRALDPEAVLVAMTAAASVRRRLAVLEAAASAVIAEHSTRDAGHSGFAQTKGHRSPVTLVQEVTGSTRADAAKQIRAGESLLATTGAATPKDRLDDPDAAVGGEPRGDGMDVPTAPMPWYAPVSDALLHHRITVEQHDAILRGLGEPPVPDSDAQPPTDDPDADANAVAEVDAVRATWQIAAEQLVAEAGQRSVEELRVAARTVRDLLDPAGAERRYDQRHQARSFRVWTDADGLHRGSFVCDDDGAALITTIRDTALRPRRGGPRFVDAEEAARAKALADDPRTHDQLCYDLIIDVLRAGMLADPATVFGTRQAGVRVIVTDTSLHAVGAGVGLLEDGGATLPAWLIAQRVCDTGTVTCTTDAAGNPLNLGREARLFTPAQRVTLALRDGGCRWPDCDRPASYCEAHHIDGWATENGRTDVDRGILLCHFHHMNLHHRDWRITRVGLGDFELHPPGNAPPVSLARRIGLQYAWDTASGPPRFRSTPAA